MVSHGRATRGVGRETKVTGKEAPRLCRRRGVLCADRLKLASERYIVNWVISIRGFHGGLIRGVVDMAKKLNACSVFAASSFYDKVLACWSVNVRVFVNVHVSLNPEFEFSQSLALFSCLCPPQGIVRCHFAAKNAAQPR